LIDRERRLCHCAVKIVEARFARQANGKSILESSLVRMRGQAECTGFRRVLHVDKRRSGARLFKRFGHDESDGLPEVIYPVAGQLRMRILGEVAFDRKRSLPWRIAMREHHDHARRRLRLGRVDLHDSPFADRRSVNDPKESSPRVLPLI
jgi:hypothetical protein